MHMYRPTGLLPALIFCMILVLSGSPAQAAHWIIINAPAKHLPGQQQKAPQLSLSRDRHLILGDQGDISAMKAKPKHASLQAVCLPNIRKKITSKSAIIIDGETGQTLFSKAADAPRQPASTIKVLTGLIAIKSLDKKDLVRISRHAARMPRSKIYLNTRKSYQANDLINAVLLVSANDASVALAEKIAGSESEFTAMMNLRAELWGATHTVCRTATGLTRRGQHTTVRDLAMIFRHAMHEDEFVRRMSKIKIRTSYGQTLRNHNKALWRVKGAIAGKTGYTSAARQTYVGQFTRDDESIIVAIMGSETMWTDIKNLVNYGFKRKKLEQFARNASEVRDNKIAMLN